MQIDKTAFCRFHSASSLRLIKIKAKAIQEEAVCIGGGIGMYSVKVKARIGCRASGRAGSSLN